MHFASNRDGLRPERMKHWGEVATNRTHEWDKPLNETEYEKEIAEYWRRVATGEDTRKICADIGKRAWET
jgi:hypothetical protein